MSEQNTVELRPAGDGMVTIHKADGTYLSSHGLREPWRWSGVGQPVRLNEPLALEMCEKNNLTITTTNSASTGSKLVDGSESRSSSQGLLDVSKDAGAEGEKPPKVNPFAREVHHLLVSFDDDPMIVLRYRGMRRVSDVIDQYAKDYAFYRETLTGGIIEILDLDGEKSPPASPADAGESVVSESRSDHIGDANEMIPSKGKVRRWDCVVCPECEGDRCSHCDDAGTIAVHDCRGLYVLHSDYERDIAERDTTLAAYEREYQAMRHEILTLDANDLSSDQVNHVLGIIDHRDLSICAPPAGKAILAELDEARRQLSQLQRDHAAEVERLKTRLVGLPSAYANVAQWQEAWEALDNERKLKLSSALARVDEVERERDEAREKIKTVADAIQPFLLELANQGKTGIYATDAVSLLLASRDALQRKVDEARNIIRDLLAPPGYGWRFQIGSREAAEKFLAQEQP